MLECLLPLRLAKVAGVGAKVVLLVVIVGLCTTGSVALEATVSPGLLVALLGCAMERHGVQVEHWTAVLLATHRRIIVLVPIRFVDGNRRYLEVFKATTSHEVQLLVGAQCMAIQLLLQFSNRLRHCRLLLLNVRLESAVEGKSHAGIDDGRVVPRLDACIQEFVRELFQLALLISEGVEPRLSHPLGPTAV